MTELAALPVAVPGRDLPRGAGEEVAELRQRDEAVLVGDAELRVLELEPRGRCGHREAAVTERDVDTRGRAVANGDVRAVEAVGVVATPDPDFAVPRAAVEAGRTLGVADRLEERPVQAAAEHHAVARERVHDVADRVATVTVRDGQHVLPLVLAAERAVDHDAHVAVAVGVAGLQEPRHRGRHRDVDELLELGGHHQLTGVRVQDLTQTDVERVVHAPLDPRLTGVRVLVGLVHEHATVGRGQVRVVDPRKTVEAPAVMAEVHLDVVAHVARRRARELEQRARKREARQVTATGDEQVILDVDVAVVEARVAAFVGIEGEVFVAGLERQVDAEGEVPAPDPEARVVARTAGAADQVRVALSGREVRIDCGLDITGRRLVVGQGGCRDQREEPEHNRRQCDAIHRFVASLKQFPVPGHDPWVTNMAGMSPSGRHTSFGHVTEDRSGPLSPPEVEPPQLSIFVRSTRNGRHGRVTRSRMGICMARCAGPGARDEKTPQIDSCSPISVESPRSGRLSLGRRSGPGSRPEAIAHAPDGRDEPRELPELAPDREDVDVHGPVYALAVHAAPVEELAAGERTILVLGQLEEDVELGRRQVDGLPVDQDLAAPGVDAEVLGPDDVRAGLPGAPKDGVDPADEEIGLEAGLADVVVGPGLEELLLERVTDHGRQDEDRQVGRLGGGSQLAADVETAHRPRERVVEEQEVGGTLLHERKTGGPVVGAEWLHPCFPQHDEQEVTNLLLVLDDSDPGRISHGQTPCALWTPASCRIDTPARNPYPYPEHRMPDSLTPATALGCCRAPGGVKERSGVTDSPRAAATGCRTRRPTGGEPRTPGHTGCGSLPPDGVRSDHWGRSSPRGLRR